MNRKANSKKKRAPDLRRQSEVLLVEASESWRQASSGKGSSKETLYKEAFRMAAHLGAYRHAGGEKRVELTNPEKLAKCLLGFLKKQEWKNRVNSIIKECEKRDEGLEKNEAIELLEYRDSLAYAYSAMVREFLDDAAKENYKADINKIYFSLIEPDQLLFEENPWILFSAIDYCKQRVDLLEGTKERLYRPWFEQVCSACAEVDEMIEDPMGSLLRLARAGSPLIQPVSFKEAVRELCKWASGRIRNTALDPRPGMALVANRIREAVSAPAPLVAAALNFDGVDRQKINQSIKEAFSGITIIPEGDLPPFRLIIAEVEDPESLNLRISFREKGHLLPPYKGVKVIVDEKELVVDEGVTEIPLARKGADVFEVLKQISESLCIKSLDGQTIKKFYAEWPQIN